MKAKRQKVSQTARDGHAAGVVLAERAAHLLLREFGERPRGRRTDAERKFDAAITQVQAALEARPDALALVREFESAVWDIAVEYENRAWHAAWTLAMHLKGGH